MIKNTKMQLNSHEFSGYHVDALKVPVTELRKSKFSNTSPIILNKIIGPEIVQPICKGSSSLNFPVWKEKAIKKTIQNSYSEPSLNPLNKPQFNYYQSNLLSSSSETKNIRENRISRRRKKSCSVNVSWLPQDTSNPDLIRNKCKDMNEDKQNESSVHENFPSYLIEQISPSFLNNES